MIEHFPGLYIRVAQRRTPTRTAVDATTDLLIDGFPRSGNSYLVSWIGRANPQLRIASHMHSIAHVHAAVRRRVPTVVVVRRPEEAIASLAVYAPQSPLERHIARYRRFHRGMRKLADAVLISPFPVTTGAPELVVDALRPRMAVALEAAPPGGRGEAMDEVDRRRIAFGGRADETKVARPSTARRPAIEQVRERLRARHGEALAELDALHDELVGRPSAITPPGG